MTKSIFLNTKINEVTEANEIKSEYRNTVNVKIKKIVMSINVTADDEKSEWENNITDDIWEKWARKTDTKRKCISSMFTDITLFVES